MKNNLLSAAAMAVVLVTGLVWRMNRTPEPTPEITLPQVEIKAKAQMPEITLPEITIEAEQTQVTTLPLPEVVISAKKHDRV